jgi:hypothetical protein
MKCEVSYCKEELIPKPILVKGEVPDQTEEYYAAIPVPSGWLIAVARGPNRDGRLVILCPQHNATGEKWLPPESLDPMPEFVMGLIASGMTKAKCQNHMCERNFITRENSSFCAPCRNAVDLWKNIEEFPGQCAESSCLSQAVWYVSFDSFEWRIKLCEKHRTELKQVLMTHTLPWDMWPIEKPSR